MDPDTLAETLEALADPAVARQSARMVQTLRGVRGVPQGEVARVAAAAWQEAPPRVPDDEDALARLFGNAWEDGLVAVGLLAAALPDAPADALQIGLDWCDRLDDIHTADALGWLVLGPGTLASGMPVDTVLDRLGEHPHPAVRRAGVMMGMAMTPTRVEGPAAAPLRSRIGAREVRFVEAPASLALARLADCFLRDEEPTVRKALRRVLGAWAASDPDAAEAWMAEVRGGVPKMLREEVEKSARKGRRKARA